MRPPRVTAPIVLTPKHASQSLSASSTRTYPVALMTAQGSIVFRQREDRVRTGDVDVAPACTIHREAAVFADAIEAPPSVPLAPSTSSGLRARAVSSLPRVVSQ